MSRSAWNADDDPIHCFGSLACRPGGDRLDSVDVEFREVVPQLSRQAHTFLGLLRRSYPTLTERASPCRIGS